MPRLSPSRRRLLQAASLGAIGVSAWTILDEGSVPQTAAVLRSRIERTGGFHLLTDGLPARVGPSVILLGRSVAFADLGPGRFGAYRSVATARAPYPASFLSRLLDTVALAGEVTCWGNISIA